VLGAVKAQIRHLRAIRKHNGASSYVTYSVEQGDGHPVSEYLILTAEADARR